MKLTLKVETADTTYEVVTNLYVMILWERKFKRKASDMATGIGLEDLSFMAYEASKLNKIVVPAEFDTFVKNLISIDVLNTEAPNPT